MGSSRPEEPGGLQSMGSRRVRHDWATSLSLFTFMHWRREWQPTPVFLPGESQGWGAWWAAVYGVAQSRTRLKRLSSSSRLSRLRKWPGAKNNVSTAGPRSGPGVQTPLWVAWKMLRWERERDRSAGFSHSEVSGPCSEINREPLKLFASRKPVCVLLAGLSLAGIIWTAPRSPTTRPSAPPLLTHLLTSREMLQSELVSQALGSRRGPLRGSL